MKPVYLTDLNQPVEQDGPHSGLQTRVSGQKFIPCLTLVHAPLFFADQVPQFLLVSPANRWEGGLTPGVTAVSGISSDELTKAKKVKKYKVLFTQ